MSAEHRTHAQARPGGPGDRLLPWPKVKEITGLSRTTAWRREKAHDFPSPVQISPGRVGWWESELTAWKASRAPRAESHLPSFPGALAPPKRCGPLALDLSPPGPEPPRAEAEAQPAPVRKRPRGRKPPQCEGQIAFEF